MERIYRKINPDRGLLPFYCDFMALVTNETAKKYFKRMNEENSSRSRQDCRCKEWQRTSL